MPGFSPPSSAGIARAATHREHASPSAISTTTSCATSACERADVLAVLAQPRHRVPRGCSRPRCHWAASSSTRLRNGFAPRTRPLLPILTKESSHDLARYPPRCRHRRRPGRPCRRRPPDPARPSREGLRGRRDRRRQRQGLGPRPPVLAVGVQHRHGGPRAAPVPWLAGAARQGDADGIGPVRGLPQAAGRRRPRWRR